MIMNMISTLIRLMVMVLLLIVLGNIGDAQTQGDFDHNGQEDLVFWNPETSEIIVYLMNGAERIGVKNLYAHKPGLMSQILSIGNLNADSTPDLIWSNLGENDLYIGMFTESLSSTKIAQSDVPDNMLSLLTAFQAVSPKIITRSSTVKDTGVIDYELFYSIQKQQSEDGQFEPVLIAYIKVSSPVIASEVYAAKFSIEEDVFVSASDLSYVADINEEGFNPIEFGDFNDDDHQDILWQNQSDRRIMIWYMNGAQFISSRLIDFPLAGTNWMIAATTDINSDGIDDLVLQKENSNQLSYWPMNDNGAVEQTVLLKVEAPEPDWVLVPSYTRYLTPSMFLEYKTYK